MKQGLIHLYCGDGKGKTTAALGLAIRALGADGKVCFAQFMKTGNSSELRSLASLERIDIVSVPNTFGFTWKMTPQQKEMLYNINSQAMITLRDTMDAYDVMILDEIVSAYDYQLVQRELVDTLLQNHGKTEIVMTGRNPAQQLLAQADYITEMKSIRHPYEKGVQARKGIEF